MISEQTRAFCSCDDPRAYQTRHAYCCYRHVTQRQQSKPRCMAGPGKQHVNAVADLQHQVQSTPPLTVPPGAWSSPKTKMYVMVQVATGWQKLTSAAIGGAMVLSVLLSSAAPAQAEPFFQKSSKPPLQEMKVRM